MPVSYYHLKDHNIVIATYASNNKQHSSSKPITHLKLDDSNLLKLVLDYREADLNALPQLLKEDTELVQKHDCIIAIISDNIKILDQQIQDLSKAETQIEYFTTNKHRMFEDLSEALDWLKSI